MRPQASDLCFTEGSPSSPGDEELITRLLDDFRALGSGIARSTAIEVDGGVVTLRGNVPTFYLRQLLVNRCQHVPGVTAVRDELTVRV